MKSLRLFSAALGLSLALSASAMAGEIHSTDKPLCLQCATAEELNAPGEMVQTTPGDIHVPGFTFLLFAIDLLT